MMIANKIALALSIIGSLNWGLVGLFGFDLVAFVTGNMTILARIIYILVAVAGIWCITMLFRGNDEIAKRSNYSEKRTTLRRISWRLIWA